jgi:hypothetical protein
MNRSPAVFPFLFYVTVKHFMINNIPDKVTRDISPVQDGIYPYGITMSAVTAQHAIPYCPPRILFSPTDRRCYFPFEILIIEIIENLSQIVKSSLRSDAELSGVLLSFFQTGLIFADKLPDERRPDLPCFNETGHLPDNFIIGIEKHPVHSDRNQIAFCSY